MIGRTIDPMGRRSTNWENLNKSLHITMQIHHIPTRCTSANRHADQLWRKGNRWIADDRKRTAYGDFFRQWVGKSTLLGMIAKNVKSDVNVIALVGERGREVAEFIEKDLEKKDCPVRSRGCNLRSACDVPLEMRIGCNFDCGIFPRSGKRHCC